MPFTVFVRLLINFCLIEITGSALRVFYTINTGLISNGNEVFGLGGLALFILYLVLWTAYFSFEIWAIAVQLLVFGYFFTEVMESVTRGAGSRRRFMGDH